MKNPVSILFLLSSLILTSQSKELVGEYSLTAGDREKHRIEYTLTLYEDGTFLFYSYTDHKNGIPWEKREYGKGKWSLDGKVVSFFTDRKRDLDEKHTLNFTNSKARFITKPPRDQTDRVIETRLQFFASEIFWIKRLTILKTKKALQKGL